MKTASKSSTHKPYHSPTIIVVAATAAFTLILLMVNILFSAKLPGTEASTIGTLYPIADAYVKSTQTTNNYGSSTDLDVKNDPANTKISYLTFDISPYSGKTILSAVLRIKTRDISYAGSAEAQNIWNVSDTSWSETQITYAVRPTISNIQLGQISNTVPSTSYDIPLNLSTFRSLMKTNPTRISMAFIGSVNSNGIYFYSKEGAVKPQLIITYDNVTPTPTKTPTPTAATTIAPTATKTPTPTPTGAACTITMTTSPTIQANSTSSVTSMLSPKTGYSATSVSYVIDTQTPASVVLTGSPYVSTSAPYLMTLTAGPVNGTARITARGTVTNTATGSQVFCDATPVAIIITYPTTPTPTKTPTPTPTAAGGGFGGLTLGQVVSGTIYITFYSDQTATDYVRFYIDTIFINEEHDYPYSLNGDTNGVVNGYDTRQLTNGQHTLKADIYFKDGSIQTYSVIFNVNNQTQPTATAIPTTTPTKTPTPTPTKTPTPTGATISIAPTATPTKTPTPTQVIVSTAPSATTVPCAMKSQGDANCDNKVDMIDYEIWRQEFAGLVTTHNADFNNNGQTELVDYETWRQSFITSINPPPTACAPVNGIIIVDAGSQQGCRDIQAAIDAAPNVNGVIKVKPGLYTLGSTKQFLNYSTFGLVIHDSKNITLEAFDLNNKPQLKIMGVSKGILWVNSSGTIKGFEIFGENTDEAQDALIYADLNSSQHDLQLLLNYIHDTGRRARGILGTSSTTGQGIIELADNNIRNTNGGVSIAKLNFYIHNNIIDGGDDHAIFVQPNGTNASSYTISFNLLTNHLGSGISVLGTGSSNLFITNNTIVNNGRPQDVAPQNNAGISIQGDGVVTVTSNIIMNNTKIYGISKKTDSVPTTTTINAFHNDVFNNYQNYFGISDQTGTNGNISIDPNFGANYCLNTSSPALYGDITKNEYMGYTGPCT